MKYIKLFEIVNKKEYVPLIQAVKRGSIGKVKEFIKNGENINKKDAGEGRTALMNAVLYKFLSIVNILINAGADVNLMDNSKRSALMMSSTMRITDKLLEAGADVNIRNIEGQTAIMEFLDYRSWTWDSMIILLEKFLKKGLDLDIKNNNGKNFYDIIKDKEVTEGSAKNSYSMAYLNWYKKLEEYMNKNFPQYKEEWELKQDIRKYNL